MIIEIKGGFWRFLFILCYTRGEFTGNYLQIGFSAALKVINSLPTELKFWKVHKNQLESPVVEALRIIHCRF